MNPQKNFVIDEEFSRLLPVGTKDEDIRLKESIIKEGCKEPIEIWKSPFTAQDFLIDGHRRLKVCSEYNIPYKITYIKLANREKAIKYMINKQLARRNLTSEQRIYYIGKLYNEYKKSHGGDRKSSLHSEDLNGRTSENIADQHHIGKSTVERAGKYAEVLDKINETAGEDLKEKILRGDINISQQEIRELELIDKEEFNIVIEHLKSGDIEKAKKKIERYKPLNDDVYDGIRVKLNEKFIIPPFSIFDAKQGYWQERKRNWMNIGIKSDFGRDENLLYPSNTIISLEEKDSSIFDPVLTEIIYKWFCSNNGLIIDPFAGGSVRGLIASFLNYRYIGIDLSEKQVKENNKQVEKVLKEEHIKPIYYVENSLNIDKVFSNTGIEADLIFSCPPYFDLESYSDDPNDLSNLTWKSFLNDYNIIINKSLSLLKNNRFACFVVSEIRDKEGYYRNFVSETIKAFIKNPNVNFYNDIILLNTIGSKSLTANRQFSSNRKVARIHQNILVFYKGNIKEIQNNFKDIEIYKFNETEKLK